MENNFKAHGSYTVTNTLGYEIELSDCGDMARVKEWGDGSKVSEWMEIEYRENPDADNEDDSLEPIIDPDGYNISLNLVMRINR